MKHISLFSGIGGFELASHWAGWTNIASCEINPFGQKVLKHYWPNAYHHDNIHTLTYDTINAELSKRFGKSWRDGQVIITGGFPCQPYSLAGKRLGKEDERHLWPEMLRVIREVQPEWAVGENVFGLINWNGGLVFNEVQADLEASGYEVQAYVLPACGVNAPHKRERVWIVAHAPSEGRKGWKQVRRSENTEENGAGMVDESKRLSNNETTTDASNEGLQWCKLNGAFDQKRWKQSPESATELYQVGSWYNFPTQSPICGGNDGIPRELDGITFPKWRNESIKAFGNAIVPQVAYQIFKAINKYNSINEL